MEPEDIFAAWPLGAEQQEKSPRNSDRVHVHVAREKFRRPGVPGNYRGGAYRPSVSQHQTPWTPTRCSDLRAFRAAVAPSQRTFHRGEESGEDRAHGKPGTGCFTDRTGHDVDHLAINENSHGMLTQIGKIMI